MGLEQILRFKQQKLLFAQKALMREPFSAQAHIDMIWGLIYNSRVPEAKKMFSLLERKIADGKLITPSDDEGLREAAINELRCVIYPEAAVDGNEPLK